MRKYVQGLMILGLVAFCGKGSRAQEDPKYFARVSYVDIEEGKEKAAFEVVKQNALFPIADIAKCRFRLYEGEIQLQCAQVGHDVDILSVGDCETPPNFSFVYKTQAGRTVLAIVSAACKEPPTL